MVIIEEDMPTFRVISYPLTLQSPVWPGNPPAAQTQAFSDINMGDSSNTTILHLFSHSGTHLDAPRHFNPLGSCAVELPIERYIFFHPYVIDVPKPDGGFVTLTDIESHAPQLFHADVVLLRTGWSHTRTSDPRCYVQQGPLLHPTAARFLMDGFPGLKAVAIDAVSIGAPDFPDESEETHRILTGVGRTDGRFILILEDLQIDLDLNRARRIYAWPLLIEGSDGSPCTIVAEFPDRFSIPIAWRE